MANLNVAGVYCIHCIPTGKKYIGSSVDIGLRISKHRSDSKTRDYPSLFIETYIKALSIVPKATDSLMKVSEFYRGLKMNFREHYGSRNYIQNSALLTFLLHYSQGESSIQNQCIAEPNVPYRGNKFWKEKLNTIREWASILKESHIWSAPYKDVPLPKSKSFIYAELPHYNSTKLMSKNNVTWSARDHQFFRKYLEEMSSVSSHYFASVGILNPSFKKMVTEYNDWSLTAVDPSIKQLRSNLKPGMLLTNYNLKGLTLTENHQIQTYGVKTSYVMEYTKSYKNIMGALI